jgi:hypothetical protein
MKSKFNVFEDMKQRIKREEFKANEGKIVQATCYNPLTCKPDPDRAIDMTLQQWQAYGFRAMKIFQATIEGRNVPSWEQVLFRDEKQFISGSFSLNLQVWLILINRMPIEMRAELSTPACQFLITSNT